MKTWTLPFVVSATLIYFAIEFCEKIPYVQRIIAAWHANDDLRYKIREVKINLVRDFIAEVGNKIKAVEMQAGNSSEWIDGTKHRPENILMYLKSDPEGAFEEAQYSLKRAWTVELTVYGEESVHVKEVRHRTSMLEKFRDKYSDEARKMAIRQAKRYADCLYQIKTSRNLAQLDSARLQGSSPTNSQQLAGNTPSE
jgi:hypothetical protein